jgi:hypothetical protein
VKASCFGHDRSSHEKLKSSHSTSVSHNKSVLLRTEVLQ